MEHIVHTIAPIFDKRSRVLILGTIPSPKSREYGFFYGHPQNRFWRVISCVLSQGFPVTAEDKKLFLLKNHIALWDVLASCDITGADDNSIKNPVANDFAEIFSTADIKAVFTTGTAATRLYAKYCLPETGFPSVYLPSTSPANQGRWPLEKLVEEYKVILKYLK